MPSPSHAVCALERLVERIVDHFRSRFFANQRKTFKQKMEWFTLKLMTRSQVVLNMFLLKDEVIQTLLRTEFVKQNTVVAVVYDPSRHSARVS